MMPHQAQEYPVDAETMVTRMAVPVACSPCSKPLQNSPALQGRHFAQIERIAWHFLRETGAELLETGDK